MAVAAACGLPDAAHAHDIRPAYLEIVEREPGAYDPLVKVPAPGEDLRFGLDPQHPADLGRLGPPRGEFTGRAHAGRIRRGADVWRARCRAHPVRRGSAAVRPRAAGPGGRLAWTITAFAVAPARIGLPPQQIPPALFAFNVEVELGQLLFVAAVRLLARAPL